jgi:uncharacterized protein (TIGR02453 family)
MTSTFTSATWAFLEQLAHDNSKTAFDARRASYRADVVDPSEAFVEALGTLLPGIVHPDLRAEAKVGRSLFRINRDTRFSKDKTPYKTHLDFIFWVGDGPPREQPACILRLTAREVLLGAGRAGLRGAALDRYRTRLDGAEDGRAIGTTVAELQAAGAVLSEPDRMKPPRPHPADHPNAELLRRDGFHLSVTRPHPDGIDDDRFPAWCAAELAPFRPILEWFAAP